MSYEVIGTTYDGKKIVKVTITGASINANSTATFTANVPALFVKTCSSSTTLPQRLAQYLAPSTLQL